MADFTKGWVTLLRSMQDNFLWKITPYDKARAWVDMILTANHKNNKFVLGNRIEIVNRGSFITSQRKLAERWGWSRNTVRSFLNLLENDGMIKVDTRAYLEHDLKNSQKTTHQITQRLSHLTILNYNDLQQATTHKRATRGATNRATPIPPLEHKQQCNNVNNDKESNVLKVDKIFEDWGILVPSFPCRALSQTRRDKINARLKEKAFIEHYKEIFKAVERNDFLTGRKPSPNYPNFKANLDWIIGNDQNYVKVLEKRYENENHESIDVILKRRHNL